MKNQLLNLKMIALMCLMMVLGGANVWAQETVTIWSEDWTGQKDGATPSSINSMYSQGNNSTVISSNGLYAGVKAPELLLKGKDKWTIKISDLKGCSGELTLSFHTNKTPQDRYPISVTANGNSIKLSVDESDKKLCTGTFSVEEGTSNVTIVFNGTTSASKNARIDDVVLTGIKAQTKKLTSLAISGQPTKTTYNVGEEFDPNGLVVTGTYDDKTTATITNGITWTKNPETMSLGNTSCTVTASVGEVKSEPFVVNGLNVVKAIVFDFTANPNAWGIKPLSSNKKGDTNEIAGKELSKDGVVMTATSGSSATCIYSTPNLRVYKEGSITFTAPEGYNLSEISFTGDKFSDKSGNKFSATEKELTISSASSATWMGNAHAVTFNAIASVQFETATIKLVAVEPVKPTFGTLGFKAQDGDGFRYATFSSDKDVVFNQKSVDVYAVSVSNEKVDTKILDAASYNVTDATVGSIEKGYYVPANTGVLIVGYDATTTYYFPAEAQTVTLPTNQLKPAPANGGVFEATADYKYYKLAYGNWTNKTQLGFYWGAPEGGKFFVKAGTAYLAVLATETTAKGFTLNGEATGIEGVNANVENAKAIYNLNGQRVASMAKPGLYIVNGKKVVRK